MNTLTIANPAQSASPTRSAGAPAAATHPGNADDGDLKFAGLLGAGIARTTDTAPVREPVENKAEDKKDAAADTPVCDPAALLDAIAAGKASLDPQQLTAAQTAAQTAVPPMPPSFAPVDPAALANATDPTALPIIARDRALLTRVRTDGGKGMPQDDRQSTATAPNATETRKAADTGPAVTIAQTPAREPAPVTAFKAELPERRQDPALQLPAVGGLPGHVLPPSQSANAASVLVHVEQLAQPFGSPAWDDGFSSHVVWMSRNDVQSAEIRLNPADLGPIEVKLVMTGDQGAQAASIQFSAAHAATREAIESALPRLREMLQESGIALGNTTVDARTAGNSNGSGDSGRPSHGSAQADARAGETPESDIQPRTGSVLRRGNGLVDTFA